MANPLMMRYAAARGNVRENERYEDREPMTRRNAYYDDRPEGTTEMRRRRDERGRFMEYNEPEEDEQPEARYQPRYMPPYAPSNSLYAGGGMGFGEQRSQHEGKPHGRKMVKAGGTFYMEPDEKPHGEKMLTRESAQEWVDAMEYSDETGREHHGGKWSMADVRPFAQKMGIPTDGEKFFEFFAMMNAMYADYMAVARKFGVTSPEFYAGMAKAWMDDPDAVDGKTMMYYDCIVKKPE